MERSISYVDTGSTLLNLALTAQIKGGWPLGRISNIIGDRSAGKTLLAMEAATRFIAGPPPGIKTPKVVYLEAEAAFDQSYAKRMGVPVEQIDFVAGTTVEAMFTDIVARCESSKAGEGTLYIIDSLDALTSIADDKKDIAKQDYDRKAGKLSEIFRKIVRKLENANIHLMVISQIRENIGALPFSPKWRRSGGKALDFYSSHIVWLHETKKIKHTKTNLVLGLTILCKISKNKTTKAF